MAGLDEGEARELARRAQAAGVLVNVEDRPSLCDFHVPAIVRRGDLVLTVSTGGRAPGLARLLREWLGRRFGPEWTGRLNDLGATRARLARRRRGPAGSFATPRAVLSPSGSGYEPAAFQSGCFQPGGFSHQQSHGDRAGPDAARL